MRVLIATGNKFPGFPINADTLFSKLPAELREQVRTDGRLDIKENLPRVESRYSPGPGYKQVAAPLAPGLPGVWVAPAPEYTINGKPATRAEYEMAQAAIRAATRYS